MLVLYTMNRRFKPLEVMGIFILLIFDSSSLEHLSYGEILIDGFSF